jgi:O-antigen ligase
MKARTLELVGRQTVGRPPHAAPGLTASVRRRWWLRPAAISSGYPLVLLVVMVVLAAHPLRVPLGGETASIFDLALVPLGLVFLGRRLARKPMNWGPRVILVALGAQLAMTMLSTTWSVNFEGSLVVTVVAAESLVVYLLVMDFGSRLRPVQLAGLLALYSLLLVASSTATFVGVPGFGAPSTAVNPGDWTNRLSHSLIGKSNNLATLLVPIAPVVWYAGRALQRWWLEAMGWVTLVATALTLSRGALLAVAGMVAVWVVVQDFSRGVLTIPPTSVRSAGVKLAIAVGGVVLLLLGLATVMTRGVSLGERLALSDNGRFDLYQEAITQASQRLLGFGPAANDVDVHNTYLQALANFGSILGTLFVVTFALMLAPWFLSAYRSGSEGSRTMTGLAFFGILAICAVESSYEGTLLRQLIWFVLALAVAWHAASARSAGGDPGWDRTGPGWNRLPLGRKWSGRA